MADVRGISSLSLSEQLARFEPCQSMTTKSDIRPSLVATRISEFNLERRLSRNDTTGSPIHISESDIKNFGSVKKYIEARDSPSKKSQACDSTSCSLVPGQSILRPTSFRATSFEINSGLKIEYPLQPSHQKSYNLQQLDKRPVSDYGGLVGARKKPQDLTLARVAAPHKDELPERHCHRMTPTYLDTRVGPSKRFSNHEQEPKQITLSGYPRSRGSDPANFGIKSKDLSQYPNRQVETYRSEFEVLHGRIRSIESSIDHGISSPISSAIEGRNDSVALSKTRQLPSRLGTSKNNSIQGIRHHLTTAKIPPSVEPTSVRKFCKATFLSNSATSSFQPPPSDTTFPPETTSKPVIAKTRRIADHSDGLKFSSITSPPLSSISMNSGVSSPLAQTSVSDYFKSERDRLFVNQSHPPVPCLPYKPVNELGSLTDNRRCNVSLRKRTVSDKEHPSPVTSTLSRGQHRFHNPDFGSSSREKSPLSMTSLQVRACSDQSLSLQHQMCHGHRSKMAPDLRWRWRKLERSQREVGAEYDGRDESNKDSSEVRRGSFCSLHNVGTSEMDATQNYSGDIKPLDGKFCPIKAESGTTIGESDSEPSRSSKQVESIGEVEESAKEQTKGGGMQIIIQLEVESSGTFWVTPSPKTRRQFRGCQ